MKKSEWEKKRSLAVIIIILPSTGEKEGLVTKEIPLFSSLLFFIWWTWGRNPGEESPLFSSSCHGLSSSFRPTSLRTHIMIVHKRLSLSVLETGLDDFKTVFVHLICSEEILVLHPQEMQSSRFSMPVLYNFLHVLQRWVSRVSLSVAFLFPASLLGSSTYDFYFLHDSSLSLLHLDFFMRRFYLTLLYVSASFLYFFPLLLTLIWPKT